MYALARISHTILADRAVLRDGLFAFLRPRDAVASAERGSGWGFGQRRTGLGGPGNDAAVRTRCSDACQAGEPRALTAVRRTAAQPQTSAAGQLDAIAILMRRTLTRTSAPILSSLRRMVPQLALANGV